MENTEQKQPLSFIDSSLYKSELVWLGFIGLILFFISSLLFSIGDAVVRFLPDKKALDNLAAIVGIFS